MNNIYFSFRMVSVLVLLLCLSACPPGHSCTDGVLNGDETGIDCGGDCEPCITPSCIDGIQNGDETGVDCGGPCVECFDCFSNYCVYLSGSTFSDPNSSIKWKCTKKDGEVFVPDMDDLLDVMLSTHRYTFYNKGDVDFMTTEGEVSGRWSFDDPEDPTEVVLTFPDESHDDWTVALLSLKEGEFVTTASEHNFTFEPE